jgi:hypothetical protein
MCEVLKKGFIYFGLAPGLRRKSLLVSTLQETYQRDRTIDLDPCRGPDLYLPNIVGYNLPMLPDLVLE